MSRDLLIRPLEEPDAEAYVALRREALVESPLAFASSPGDDLMSSLDEVRAQLGRIPDAVILGAWEESLVGAVGLVRDRHVKAAHKALLWGMYVTGSRRRNGIASRLLAGAIEHARALDGVCLIELGVSSAAPAAQQLYELAGFRAWGTEPEALRHAGRSVSELHMHLALE